MTAIHGGARLGHEILSTLCRTTGHTVLAKIRDWCDSRISRAPAVRTPAPANHVMLGARPVRPFEDESDADFSERVARIKADMLSRALSASDEERLAKARAAARAAQRAAPASGAEADWVSLEGGRHPWSVKRRPAPVASPGVAARAPPPSDSSTDASTDTSREKAEAARPRAKPNGSASAARPDRRGSRAAATSRHAPWLTATDTSGASKNVEGALDRVFGAKGDARD